jgi:hypothetical protein
MVKRYKASFEEAMDIELERIRSAMDRGKLLAERMEPPVEWPQQKAYAYLIRVTVKSLAEAFEDEDLEAAAASLVHLAAASKAFFDTFVEDVEVEELEDGEEPDPDTNAKGSTEKN